MTTKAVIHAKSALPMQTKRTVLTQEVLRILLHCSKYVKWETILWIFATIQVYRRGFSTDAMKLIREKEALGIRPINRPKEWRRVEREKEKLEKKQLWFKSGGFDSVLFVPATPDSKLKNLYQREIMKSGFRVKVVEKVNTSLKSRL